MRQYVIAKRGVSLATHPSDDRTSAERANLRSEISNFNYCTLTEVSSIKNDVCSELSSTPRK